MRSIPVVRFLIAADLKARWRPLAVLAVLVAVAFGVSVAALAAARRTDTSYARFLDHTEAVDVSVLTPFPDLDAPGRVAALRGVTKAGTYAGLFIVPIDEESRENVFNRVPEVVGSIDGRFFDFDRPAVIEGRLPDPASTTEVAVSHDSPPELGPGAQVRLRFQAGDEEEIGVDTASTDAPEEIRTFRVVGRVRFPFAVLNDEIDTDGAGRILVTPSATAELLDFTYYLWTGVFLNEDTTVADFTAAVGSSGDSVPSSVQTAAAVRTHVDRAVRPQVVALDVLAAVLAAGALIALAGGAARLIDPRSETRTLAALGLSRRQRALVAAAPAALATVAGAIGAVLFAVVLSLLSPIGEMRDIEPNPGVAFDAPAVLGGVGVLLAFLLLGLTALAWRASRVAVSAPPAAPNRLLTGFRRRVPLPLALGSRLALEDRTGRLSFAGLAMVLGNVVAVVALTGSVVFGASLQGLVEEPARAGWNWDVFVSAGGGYGAFDPDGVDEVVTADPSVAGWSLVGFAQVQVAQRSVPALGIDAVRGDVRPPIAHGRSVRSGTEVVVGAVSLRQLGLAVGDSVVVASGENQRRFRVVGSGPMPTLGTILADHPSLGVGILFDLATLRDLVAPDASGGPASVAPSGLLVRTRPGTNPGAVAERIAARRDTLSPVPEDVYVQPTIQAADIRNYEEMGSQPLVIAAALVLLAFGTLLLSIRTAVDRRRKDLALLLALGLRPRDLRRTLFGHSAFTLVLALAIGLPLGVIAGRLAWEEYAEGMGVLPEPIVPLLGLGAITAILVGLGLGLTVLPARRARHLRPADALRSEAVW